jgi:hypothetical protein
MRQPKSWKTKDGTITATMKIVILKAEAQRQDTATEKRWLELMTLEVKTVKGYIDKVGEPAAIRDLKWWRDRRRIDIV